MADNYDKIKEILGADGGLKVPDGFFESAFGKIQSELPPYPEAPRPVKLSTWHRLRPYVYLAAMFAGIWLMMTVFHHVSSSSSQLSLENIPEQIAMAMEDPEGEAMLFDYVAPDTDDYELENEVASSYDNISQFEEAFGYELSPEYASMPVE